MDFKTLVLAIAGIIVGLVLGWMRGRQLLAGAVSRREYDALMQEKTALAARLEALLQDKKEQAARLEKTESTLTEYHERAITAESGLKAEQQKQQQLKVEFENTANALLEKINAKFIDQSEKKIGDLLTPMQERLNDFKKLVTDSFSEQGKEQRSLKDVISGMMLQTDGLTKALRGDVKAQGNWGEVMLERILEESGLRRDTDYVLQGADMKLSGSDGTRQRPDVIVNLPDSKHIIIDAKVSLVAYERYSAETDSALKEVHLREFLKSVKAHVNGLEERRYQDNEKLATPDFVLMFMPIEGAYSLAVQQDRELHSYAWGKRIVIVCPATLFATLRTIASIWSIERQNKNAQQIAAEAAKMYDKFVDFITDMDGVGSRLVQLQTRYDDAFNKLSKGRGNLVSRAEKLKDYGVKTTKPMPKGMAIDDDIEEDAPALRIATAEG